MIKIATAACSGTPLEFKCNQHTSEEDANPVIQETIPMSQVFDGHCDCCDGCKHPKLMICCRFSSAIHRRLFVCFLAPPCHFYFYHYCYYSDCGVSMTHETIVLNAAIGVWFFGQICKVCSSSDDRTRIHGFSAAYLGCDTAPRILNFDLNLSALSLFKS